MGTSVMAELVNATKPNSLNEISEHHMVEGKGETTLRLASDLVTWVVVQAHKRKHAWAHIHKDTHREME